MSPRVYSSEYKQQCLAHLALETSHREELLQARLENGLNDFKSHQVGLLARIPKVVMGMKMSEFAQKYHGDTVAALRGANAERLGPQAAEIDRDTRKRKWVASHEADLESSASQDAESSRAVKTARIAVATPKKKPGSSTGPGTAQRARLLATNKTPGTTHTMGRPIPVRSPSPHKLQRQLGNGFPRPSSRPASPSKPVPNPRSARPPSLAMFNPSVPQGPSYPPKTPAPAVRMPRKDETFLSMNGSPLANPFELGTKWYGSGAEEGEQAGQRGSDHRATQKRPTHQRVNSITVRRDPSVAPGGYHSRTTSQTTSMFAPVAHPNPNNLPHGPPQPPTHSRQPSSSSSSHLFPSTSSHPFPSSGSGLFATVATKNGDLLELNPLETSPGALAALEGVSESAKKGARVQMGQFAQEMSKWNLNFTDEEER